MDEEVYYSLLVITCALRSFHLALIVCEGANRFQNLHSEIKDWYFILI